MKKIPRVVKAALTLVLVLSLAPPQTLPGSTIKNASFISYPQRFILRTLTVYNPVRNQCDSNPFITASNKEIDIVELREGRIRWIALSRDMLSRWGGVFHYGDTISITSGDRAIDGEWVIQDTMNKRFEKHGDLLYHISTRSSGKWNNVMVTRYRKMYRPATDGLRAGE